tara:strand:- start:4781 stop:6970 length:2190 start_codon:yes stop_codon:yes gene_type:complete
MAIKPLLVKIGADTTGLERGLKRAGRNLAGLAKAAGAAGVLVGGALAAMTTQGLAAVDAQTKLARSIDGSVNALRAVQIAAGYAGVSVGEANTAMQQLNRELEAAKEKGSPAQKALAKLGMTASDLAGLDSDERMAALADRINELGLSSGQASDILRDLGVRSRNMALLLIQGGDAIRSAREEVTAFGLELTKAQTDSIESANDAVARMSLVFDSLRQRLAVEVAPILQTMADRFNTLAQSDAVQTAIERLAGAFGQLANTILTEDFMEVAIGGLTGIANISAGVAEGMVTLSQNVEIVTLAFSGLAIAVALAGGPFTVIVGLLALALGGIALWRKKAEDAATGTDTLTTATDGLTTAEGELATAIATFTANATPANQAAVDRATYLRDQARAAVDAAEAEALLNKQYDGRTFFEQTGDDVVSQAQERFMQGGTMPTGAGQNIGGNGAGKDIGLSGVDPEPFVEGASPFDALRKRLDAAYISTPPKVGTPASPEIETVTIPPVDIPGGGGTAGLSTADQLREQLEQRLEVLTEGLATEAEVVAQWYEEGQTVLDDALAKGLLTEEEYREQRERLEEEHQNRMNAIKKAGAASDLAIVAGAGAEILNAIGQNNKKALKIAKVFSAAQALINTYQGASKELAKGGIAGFAAAAAVIAQGIGFVNAIKSVSDNGTGGGGGSTGTSSAASAPAAPTQTVSINLQGDTFSRGSVEGLLEQIQSQLDRGGRLVFA